MGLFDFVGNIGKKIFNKEEDASQAVTNHIAEDNPGIDNVAVTVENGVAKLSGVAATAEAAEKAILMAGNIEGIESVNIDAIKVLNGSLGGDERLRDGLAAEHPLPGGLRAATTVQVVLDLLEIENGEEFLHGG